MTTINPSSKAAGGLSVREMLTQLALRREWGVALLLAITITAVAIVNPDFISASNIRDMLVNNSAYAIIACGATFVIVTGEIDISMGSLAGLCAAVLGLLSAPDHANLGAASAIVITLGVGLAVGLINGFLVAYARVPSIIVTLGMLTALRGLTKILMGDEWITVTTQIRWMGTGRIAGVDVCVIVAIVVIIASMILATRTPLGRRIYAVGSNPQAARLAGLSPRRIKLFVFALTGLLVGVAVLVDTTRLPKIESDYGTGWELFIVTAVIVGGTSISGGKGTIIGSILAVLLLGIVRSVLIFLKLGLNATYWERAIQGGFILLAVLADHLARRGRHGEEPG
jgi:ribose/xylose/arabinose/galactoside ABC-type transport system permease subunit